MSIHLHWNTENCSIVWEAVENLPGYKNTEMLLSEWCECIEKELHEIAQMEMPANNSVNLRLWKRHIFHRNVPGHMRVRGVTGQ